MKRDRYRLAQSELKQALGIGPLYHLQKQRPGHVDYNTVTHVLYVLEEMTGSSAEVTTCSLYLISAQGKSFMSNSPFHNLHHNAELCSTTNPIIKKVNFTINSSNCLKE